MSNPNINISNLDARYGKPATIKQRNQTGFTIIEILLVIGVIAILGLLGFVAYNQIINKSKTNSTSQTSGSAITKNDTINKAQDATQGDAETLVTKFYSNYLKVQKADDAERNDAIKNYTTQSFYNTYVSTSQYDAITCQSRGDGTPADDANVMSSTTGNNGYVVNVGIVWANSGGVQSNGSILVSVINGDSGLAIDKITCPHA